jgi:aspartate beta-hydroxylase
VSGGGAGGALDATAGTAAGRVCGQLPTLCSALRTVEEAAAARGAGGGLLLARLSALRGSASAPTMRIWPHCGPTNARLRLHLPLVVPASGEYTLTVAGVSRSWREGGAVLLFDDHFRHDVLAKPPADGDTDTRLVLIVDVWHPQVPLTDRVVLSRRMQEWSERGARLMQQQQ